MVCRFVLSLSNSVSPTDNNFTIDSLWQLSHVHYQQHLMGLKFYLVLNPANPEIDFKFRDHVSNGDVDLYLKWDELRRKIEIPQRTRVLEDNY